MNKSEQMYFCLYSLYSILSLLLQVAILYLLACYTDGVTAILTLIVLMNLSYSSWSSSSLMRLSVFFAMMVSMTKLTANVLLPVCLDDCYISILSSLSLSLLCSLGYLMLFINRQAKTPTTSNG